MDVFITQHELEHKMTSISRHRTIHKCDFVSPGAGTLNLTFSIKQGQNVTKKKSYIQVLFFKNPSFQIIIGCYYLPWLPHPPPHFLNLPLYFAAFRHYTRLAVLCNVWIRGEGKRLLWFEYKSFKVTLVPHKHQQSNLFTFGSGVDDGDVLFSSFCKGLWRRKKLSSGKRRNWHMATYAYSTPHITTALW